MLVCKVEKEEYSIDVEKIDGKFELWIHMKMVFLQQQGLRVKKCQTTWRQQMENCNKKYIYDTLEEALKEARGFEFTNNIDI